MIVTAREFTSAAEMRASAAAVHARLFGKAPPVVKAIPEKRPMPIRLPRWMVEPTRFDAHVFAFSSHVRSLELQAAGDAEAFAEGRISMLEITMGVLVDFPDVTVSEVRSHTRRRVVCLARATAMYEARRQRPDLSYPQIGLWFGDRDHTTVIAAERKIMKIRGEA